MGATLPVKGPETSAAIVRRWAVPALPAASIARNDTSCLFESGAATGPVYSVHAPAPTMYSMRATPDVASVAVTVTVRAVSSSTPVLTGAVRSIATVWELSVETFPALSVARAATTCRPSPPTATSTNRTLGVLDHAASSTRVATVTRPPPSSVPVTRTVTSERYHPFVPAEPLTENATSGAVSSPSVSAGSTTVTVPVTRPAA
ncbi:hypothetical protein D3C74_373700 [compost metagenome]